MRLKYQKAQRAVTEIELSRLSASVSGPENAFSRGVSVHTAGALSRGPDSTPASTTCKSRALPSKVGLPLLAQSARR
jgi:hypothetical protein